MDEARIKAAILTQVRRAAGRRSRPVVAPEFALGRSGVRADLAILAEDFIGIEIKSAQDTLRRLRVQLDAYSLYFDRVVLVVADRHVQGIDATWLKGAALWRVSGNGEIREVIPADTHLDRDPMALFELLPQQDRRRLPATGKHEIDREAAKAHFLETFRGRYGPTSASFWTQVRGRKIIESDLPALSRFAELRSVQRQHAEDRDEFWRRWAEESTNSHD